MKYCEQCGHKDFYGTMTELKCPNCEDTYMKVHFDTEEQVDVERINTRTIRIPKGLVPTKGSRTKSVGKRDGFFKREVSGALEIQ